MTDILKFCSLYPGDCYTYYSNTGMLLQAKLEEERKTGMEEKKNKQNK
jgi:hypothetical protein